MPPGVGGGRLVLPGQPSEVVPVRRDRRQRHAAVQGEQLTGEHLHRPAVQEQVVGGEQQAAGVVAQLDQREPEQRWSVECEAVGPFGDEQPVEFGRLFDGVEMAKVDLAPGQVDGGRDELDRLPGLGVPEPGAEVGVPVEQAAYGGAQGGHVEVAVDVHGHPGDVDVLCGLVVLGVEEQALLRGRQRQHVDQSRLVGGQPVDLGLRQGHQRQVGGDERAAGTGLGVCHQRRQRVEPRPRHVGDGFLGQQLARPDPGGGEPGAVNVGFGHGVEGQRVRQRRGRVGAASDPAGHLPVAELAQVVEADLGGGELRQGHGGARVEVTQQAVPDAVVGDGP